MSDRVSIYYGGALLLAEISHSPPRVQVGATIFQRVDDPDTGESLGCYVSEATR